MNDIVNALRLAKERAIESENDLDLAVFRDAEKQAMDQARAADKLARLRAIYRETRHINALPENPPTRWTDGFHSGAQWTLNRFNNVLGVDDGDV